MKNKIFVFDTNVLISAFLFKFSNPRIALEIAFANGKLTASLETYNEFKEVFLRSKFDKYISIEERLLSIEDFQQRIHLTELSETITTCRDPKDNKFLELAISANATCIITGDNDLLMLHPFRDIPILNVVDFIGFRF
ncbi:MAG: putative toxin-antitoxin system toxin component, PIN family [Chitinophagaceae bacterium]